MILVFDFGGGTLDVAIVSIDDQKFVVKASDGDPNLGGQDIDNAIVQHLFQKIEEEHKEDLRDKPKVRAKLRVEAN